MLLLDSGAQLLPLTSMSDGDYNSNPPVVVSRGLASGLVLGSDWLIS